MDAELAAFGAPADYAAAVCAQRPSALFDVLADNAEALALFLRMATQWTVNHNGVVGMNYQSLQWLMGLSAPATRHLALLDDLQAMEAAVLPVLKERAA